jgi:hypothetical protein
VLTDAALTANGELILDTGIVFLPPGEHDHTAVRVSSTYGPEEIAKFKIVTPYFGTGVVASGDSWWYSIAGGRGKDDSGVFFLTPEPSFVKVEEFYDGDWIAFDEPEPHGLLVGHRRDGLHAAEITRGGVRKKWRLPDTNVVGHRLRDAELLSGGEIALVSIRDGAVHLQVLGDPEIVLRRSGSPVRVRTARTDDGMLGVLIETRLGELEAAVFDPKNPGDVTWQQLTTKEDPGRFPEIVFHDGKFIAAWLVTEMNELRARTFTASGMAATATIAPVLRRGGRLPSISILPDGEEILLVWQEDEVMSRRVPAELGGFGFLERLCALF